MPRFRCIKVNNFQSKDGVDTDERIVIVIYTLTDRPYLELDEWDAWSEGNILL